VDIIETLRSPDAAVLCCDYRFSVKVESALAPYLELVTL